MSPSGTDSLNSSMRFQGTKFMRLLRWIVAVMLIGSVLSCVGAADSAGPTPIDEPGAVSFSDLGWTEDIVVKGDSPPATVRVMLPEDAKQGKRLWYGVRLDFEITGTPGPGEDRAYLVASWNQRAMYFMPLENVAALANGFSWTTHEPLSGWRLGYETTGTFPAASTSFAILDAIQGGMNEIAIRLDMGLASNPDFQARISKESQVVAVHWSAGVADGQGTAALPCISERLP